MEPCSLNNNRDSNQFFSLLQVRYLGNLNDNYLGRRNFANAAAVQVLEKDYYTILDIPVTATPEQIKEQYRRLAKKYHPDVRTSEKGIDH